MGLCRCRCRSHSRIGDLSSRRIRPGCRSAWARGARGLGQERRQSFGGMVIAGDAGPLGTGHGGTARAQTSNDWPLSSRILRQPLSARMYKSFRPLALTARHGPSPSTSHACRDRVRSNRVTRTISFQDRPSCSTPRVQHGVETRASSSGRAVSPTRRFRPFACCGSLPEA
jgi:hypothetical protein